MLPALLAVIVGGGLLMLSASMMVTGVAQKELWPRLKGKARELRQKIEATTAGSAAPTETTPAPAADAMVAASASPEDSLRSLQAQIQTQRRFLEVEKSELVALRASIDSLLTRYDSAQNAEATRQAKLLAAMKPAAAAAILARMDDASMDAVLASMNAKSASRVVAALDPDRVARLAMEGMTADALAALPLPSTAAAISASQPAVEDDGQ